MTGKFNNYFGSLAASTGDNQTDGSRAQETLSSHIFDGTRILLIGRSIVASDAEEIRDGLQKTYRITDVKILKYIPEVLKAVRDGLMTQNSVQKVYFTRDLRAVEPLPQEVLTIMREILSIPRLLFDINWTNDPTILQVIRGTSTKYITNLRITVNSQQLDELLYELRSNKIIQYIGIEREQLDSKCKNLSFFGNFKQLHTLKMQIRADETKQFFKTMQQLNLLTLDLSSSTIGSQQAHHLADLIRKTTSLASLDLSACAIDNNILSKLFLGLLENDSIQELSLRRNPFDQLDLTGVNNKLLHKKLKHLNIDIFYTNMAKLFKVHDMTFSGTKFDGFKNAKIDILTLAGLFSSEQVVNFFEAIKNNRFVRSLIINEANSDVLSEICRQMIVNKTLKSIDFHYLEFDEKSFKLLCEMIEKNHTLESFFHGGTFTTNPDVSFTHQPLLEALKKNKSLTKVDFYHLTCEDWEVEEVLKANPFLTFTELANRTRGSRASKLNAKNKQNIQRRLNNTKCNVMSFARSYLSSIVPIELWQLIMNYVDLTDVDYFELFKQSMRQ